MPPERLASRLVLRSASRPVLLACLICPAALLVGSSSHPLAFSSAACFLLIVSSVRPLPRIARLPVSSTSGTGRDENAIDCGHRMAGGCLLAYPGWRRGVGGHRRRMAAGVGVGVGCLLASGRWTERLDRSSIVPLFLSSSHPIGSAPAHPHHLIISSTGEESSFPFRLTPSRLPFSVCLLWLVPPSPAGGCVSCGMACGGGRADCLLAFSSPVPLVRSLLYDLCQSCRSFLPGVLWGVLWVILPAILSALAFLNICP